MKCECPYDTVVSPEMDRATKYLYNPVTELPFRNHKANECKCTVDLKRYLCKDNEVRVLCSCCCTASDVELPLTN